MKAFKALATFAQTLQDGPSVTTAINHALQGRRNTPISEALSTFLTSALDGFAQTKDAFVLDELSDKDK